VLGRQLGLLGDTKPGVPPLERAGETAVEHIGTDLQQQMESNRTLGVRGAAPDSYRYLSPATGSERAGVVLDTVGGCQLGTLNANRL
jgi:hypothetical protein